MSKSAFKSALASLRGSITNLIKTAYISGVNDDSSAYPATQVRYKNKTANATRISPYGLDSNPPSGSFVLLLNAYSQEANKFAICADTMNRFKNLEEGEIALFNTLTQSHVILKSNGDINIQANGNINITATGNVNIQGDVTIQGINWISHKHSGVTAGEAISGPVVA